MSIPASNYVPVLGNKTVTIPNGGTVSTAIDTKGATPLAMFLPASGWTTSDITFLASYDGVTFLANPIQDNSGVYTLAAAAGGTPYSLSPAIFAGMQAIKVVSSNVQTGAQNIVISFGPVIAQQNIG